MRTFGIPSRLTALAVGSLLALTGGIGCDDDDVSSIDPTKTTISSTVAGDARFDTLGAALVAAELVTTLAGEGPFTVFAPTDEAFEKLAAGTLDSLLLPENKAQLQGILQYHVVRGALDAAAVVEMPSATTLEGSDISIEVVGGEVILNGGAKVTITDIVVDNGIIHVIDTVLLPPVVESNTIADIVIASDDFDTLETAVIAADLVGLLGGTTKFTVFAPTDDAFAKIPAADLAALLADKDALTDVLTYHALPGEVNAAAVVNLSMATAANGAVIDIEVVDGEVILNGTVKVTMTDIIADNGIIHVIDTVLSPPPTIAAVVEGDSNFSTLLTALNTASLTDVLRGAGPFTVFAPTNAAFDKIDAADLAALLADDTALNDVLLYHVLSGEKLAADVVAESFFTMENGAIVPVTTEGGAQIGGAVISMTDIVTRNGIIHVIDSVLLPPPSIGELAGDAADLSTLVVAATAASLVDTLVDDGPFTVFAPTNAAFDKIAEADLNALVADVPALTDVLLYHVIDGVIPASVAVTATTATMKNGDAISLAVVGEAVVINGASTVVGTDIWARNGVIHLIDTVLFPPE
ncbi:MAG: transforming growth factor-beta-induced protein [Myxococcota bacterium]|jgi:transforming growth factor-beta-induced protein